MYRDNSLIPREAVRLLALGILATSERRYADLAGDVRAFTSHISGPSLDLVAPPLELLKVEGLIEAVEGEGVDDHAVLRITESGRRELKTLLTANVRPPISAINKLIIALKMRFLHVLEPDEQRLQVEALVEMCEREIARLVELRSDEGASQGHFAGWLDHDIAQVRGRLAWFETLRERLP